MMQTSLPQVSEIDTEVLGVRTARTNDLTAESIPGLLESCFDAEISLLIARCDAADFGAIHAAEAAGFQLMGTQLHMKLATSAYTTHQFVNHDHEIRPCRPDEVGVVEDLARRAFAEHTGHYHSDPRLERSRCAEIYARWAVDCCTGLAADTVLVAARGQKIAAFVSIVAQPEGSAASIPLIAVDASQRRSGILAVLGNRSNDWMVERKLDWRLCTVDVGNIPIMNGVLASGYRPLRTEHTFHRWF